MFTSPVNVSYFRLSFFKCMESVDVRVGLEGGGASIREGSTDKAGGE